MTSEVRGGVKFQYGVVMEKVLPKLSVMFHRLLTSVPLISIISQFDVNKTFTVAIPCT